MMSVLELQCYQLEVNNAIHILGELGDTIKLIIEVILNIWTQTVFSETTIFLIRDLIVGVFSKKTYFCANIVARSDVLFSTAVTIMEIRSYQVLQYLI